MKLIEIKDGISINIDKIESVHKTDNQLGCVVKAGFEVYEAELPYDVLITMLSEDKDKKEEMLERMYRVMQTQGSFAG